MPRPSTSSSDHKKSSMPLGHMKALNAMTPRSASSSMRSRFVGVRPPHRPKSTYDDASRAARFTSNDGPSSVGGDEFSGISQKNVPPPAARAKLPVEVPSQSVRPGSLK